MTDTEWTLYLSFYMKKPTLIECIPNLKDLATINIYRLISLLENVIKQRYYFIIEKISITY